MKRGYVCNSNKNLKVGVGPGHRMVEFQGGKYVTSDPDEIRAIEKAKGSNRIVDLDVPEDDADLSEYGRQLEEAANAFAGSAPKESEDPEADEDSVTPPPSANPQEQFDTVEPGLNVSGIGTEKLKELRK